MKTLIVFLAAWCFIASVLSVLVGRFIATGSNQE